MSAKQKGYYSSHLYGTVLDQKVELSLGEILFIQEFGQRMWDLISDESRNLLLGSSPRKDFNRERVGLEIISCREIHMPGEVIPHDHL